MSVEHRPYVVGAGSCSCLSPCHRLAAAPVVPPPLTPSSSALLPICLAHRWIRICTSTVPSSPLGGSAGVPLLVLSPHASPSLPPSPAASPSSLFPWAAILSTLLTAHVVVPHSIALGIGRHPTTPRLVLVASVTLGYIRWCAAAFHRWGVRCCPRSVIIGPPSQIRCSTSLCACRSPCNRT